MFHIKTKGENRYVHALIQNVADIPGGVTIGVTDLVDRGILKEGTVVGFDAAGIARVIKSASVYEKADANATSIKISKGSHFKAGDFLTDGTKAVAIASIDSGSSNVFDTVTLTLNDSKGLGALAEGDVLEQAKAAADSGAELAYDPAAMTAEAYEVKAEENLWVPAVVIGTFKKSLIPPVSKAVLAKLKGIVLL